MNYGASAGLGESDNINLSSTDRKAQTLAAANLFLDLLRSGSRLELNAVGNFGVTHYLQGAFSNQVLGRFDGLANLTLWQHHLTWLVRDIYGNSQINVLQAPTPTNLQRINVISTGPDLMLQPTPSNFVELRGLYSRNKWQDSPFSGNTETGTFTVGHQLSPTGTLSLVGQVQQERFDDTIVNKDYQLRSYYGRYILRGARTLVDLQSGLTQADDTGSWRSSPLVRALITRNVSPFSTVSFSAGRDYTNATSSFASLATGTTGDIPIAPAAQTTANALRTYGNVGWGFQHLRTTLNVLGGWERDAYDLRSQFDVDRADADVSLRRQLTPKLSANISASLHRWHYMGQGFTDTFGTPSAGLEYRPGAWLVIYCRYYHQFRNVSGPTPGRSYDENRVYLMIGYYPNSNGTVLPGEAGMGGGNGFP